MRAIVVIDLLTILHLQYVFPKVEDEPNKVSDPDRTAIKANIVNLMLSSPEQIQKQVHPHMAQCLKGSDLNV